MQAVELALRTAEEEAQERLAGLLVTAKKKVTDEKQAALRRVSRWLSQNKVKKVEADKVVSAEAAVYDAAAAALEEVRLELDQASLIQLA